MTPFSDMGLSAPLLQSIENIGFLNATDVQQKSIPPILEGRDVMVCAETGSGKTGAYLIPMLEALSVNIHARGLVLVPTRELAQQVGDFLDQVSSKKTLQTAKLIGGQDIRKQFQSLKKKPRVVVATPGRLIDHLKRKTLQLGSFHHLVLDEGDRMIDMGFAPQLKEILKQLPEDRQTSFFTATVDNKVKDLTKQYLNQPVTISLGKPKPVSKIHQEVIQVAFKDKDERILDEVNRRDGSIIVFLKTKYRTDRLKQYLDDYGVAVDSIHGGKSQGQRNKAISSFKRGRVRVLVATDVAARGLDVPHVEHVINFDLPMQDEDYVHRVGRTARNGAEGEAVSFVTPEEKRAWNRIVKKYEIPNAMLEVKGRDKGKSSKSGFGSRNKKSFSFSNSERKPFGAKKRRSFGDNEEENSFGDRRKKTSSNKDEGSWGFKKKRSFSDRDENSYGDRRQRTSSNKEEGSWGSKKKRSFGDRDENSYGDKRKRTSSNKEEGSFGFKKKRSISKKSDSPFEERKSAGGSRKKSTSSFGSKKRKPGSKATGSKKSKSFGKGGKKARRS